MLSSRSIIVSHFTFRSVFQFESALLKCVMAGSGLLVSVRDAQLLSTICQRLFLLPCTAFAPLSGSS